jgi:hypothetical protein
LRISHNRPTVAKSDKANAHNRQLLAIISLLPITQKCAMAHFWVIGFSPMLQSPYSQCIADHHSITQNCAMAHFLVIAVCFTAFFVISLQ